MKRILLFLVLLFATSLTLTSIAQFDCPTLVEAALTSTDTFCLDTGRNQACFGNINLSAEAQPDAGDFKFVEVGDIVDVAAIRSLRLSALDTSAGAWGVVLMRVQANLPDSTPGQNVTFMLFGDTEIRNVATSVAEQNLVTLDAQISSSGNANVRVGPNSTMTVRTAIANGTNVVANGISPDNQWIRIVIPNSESSQFGWISKQLLRTSGDFNILKVVESSEPQFGPMQAFYLSTGIGEPACNEMPENGLLIQTPKGLGEINLLVNEVEISMGSTVFLSAPRNESVGNNVPINVDSMQVKTIEGAAIARINDATAVALGGSQFEVMYDDVGAIKEIGELVRLEVEEIADLPYGLLERAIELKEPLTDEELDIIDQYDKVFDFVDIEDTDELLDFLEESGGDNLIEFLQNDLGIESFDADMAEFFEGELDISIESLDADMTELFEGELDISIESFDADMTELFEGELDIEELDDDEFDDNAYDEITDDGEFDDGGFDGDE